MAVPLFNIGYISLLRRVEGAAIEQTQHLVFSILRAKAVRIVLHGFHAVDGGPFHFFEHFHRAATAVLLPFAIREVVRVGRSSGVLIRRSHKTAAWVVHFRDFILWNISLPSAGTLGAILNKTAFGTTAYRQLALHPHRDVTMPIGIHNVGGWRIKSADGSRVFVEVFSLVEVGKIH